MAGKVSVMLDPADLSPDEIYKRVRHFGRDWADKKSAYVFLEDMTATVRAKCMKDSHSDSVAAKKLDAEASLTFERHIKELADARRAYLRAEVEWKCSQILSELRRTQAATERAKMNLL